ncbi:retrovirus-related pol polyprotein from transposon TNT 1-94 [Tanacetum coccineum]
MSNTNTNLQTQTSNALHNAIMEAGGKDRPPMLAPGNYVQWKSRIKRYIDTKPNNELIYYCLQNPPYKFKWTDKVVPVEECSSKTTTEGYMENYKNISQDIRDHLNAEAEAVQIILTGIDNDIYSTVDACPNACEMWKAIERLKQVNVQALLQLQPEWQRFVTLVKQTQELKTVSYHKLYDILKQHQNEVNEIRAKRLAPNFRNRGKAIVNSSPPTDDQEPTMVAEDDEMSKEKEIDKLMALISLSFKKIYKPTNNNLRTLSNTTRANQDNTLRINRGTGYDNQRVVNVVGSRENVGTQVVHQSGIQCYNCKEYEHVARECQKPKRAKDAAYHKEKMILCKQEEAGFLLNAEQADWRDDTDDEPEDQELEAHYLYMAQIQEVTPDAADNSGPIFDAEPLQKVQNNDDNYNVFAIESEHPEQPKSVNDTYPVDQDEHNIIIDSLDMSYDREQDDQDDDDLAKERDLLASLIEKLKCEIDDNKNRNKFLETSNKALVDKLKGEIEDFKTKNKSLESSNNHFKEANNELSKTNQLMFKDLKKFQAELDRYHDVNYASKVAIDCAKAKGDLMSYKMESEKSFNEYTRKINDLNQTISEMKKELFAHQETISIMSQEKEAQIKFYKTREDKEIEKVIALENKVKALDDIVYKTGQSVQTMNMLNRNCKTSFVKPEFLKKAQRANPRLYDIGCYNDNLALMLAPESDETIRLAQESRSKLIDSLKSQLETQKTQFLNEIDRLSREYYYVDHMNAILGMYITLDEFTDLQCDYVDQVVKCERLEKELSKSTITSKSFEALQQHAINLELALQQFTAQILLQNVMSILKNTNVIDPGMYKVNTKPNQTRTPQLPQDIRKTNKRVSFSTGVIPTTSISKPQPKSNQLKERVMSNNSQGKKQEVEDHHRNFKFSNNKTFVTACNDSLNVETSNLVEIILFIIDSGCLKHMTGNLKLLSNFMKKFLGTVKFKNDHIAPILGYGDLVQGNVTIKSVYYVERLNHNLFSVGQFCDADLEVAFRKSTCYIRDLKGNDLLTGSRGTDLYSITLQDTSTPNPICLMAKATSSQA